MTRDIHAEIDQLKMDRLSDKAEISKLKMDRLSDKAEISKLKEDFSLLKEKSCIENRPVYHICTGYLDQIKRIVEKQLNKTSELQTHIFAHYKADDEVQCLVLSSVLVGLNKKTYFIDQSSSLQDFVEYKSNITNIESYLELEFAIMSEQDNKQTIAPVNKECLFVTFSQFVNFCKKSLEKQALVSEMGQEKINELIRKALTGILFNIKQREPSIEFGRNLNSERLQQASKIGQTIQFKYARSSQMLMSIKKEVLDRFGQGLMLTIVLGQNRQGAPALMALIKQPNLEKVQNVRYTLTEINKLITSYKEKEAEKQAQGILFRQYLNQINHFWSLKPILKKWEQAEDKLTLTPDNIINFMIILRMHDFVRYDYCDMPDIDKLNEVYDLKTNLEEQKKTLDIMCYHIKQYFGETSESKDIKNIYHLLYLLGRPECRDTELIKSPITRKFLTSVFLMYEIAQKILQKQAELNSCYVKFFYEWRFSILGSHIPDFNTLNATEKEKIFKNMTLFRDKIRQEVKPLGWVTEEELNIAAKKVYSQRYYKP